MKSFSQVFKEALRYKEAKICFILTVVGVIAAFGVAYGIKDRIGLVTVLLMGLTLMVTFAGQRFGAYIKAIREEDLKAHGKTVYKADKPKKKKKK